MFSKELQGYISHGREEVNLEYKSSRKWIKGKKGKSNIDNLTIIKAMLAMANIADGGVIIIGEKEKENGEFYPTGLSNEKYDSFKYDDIAKFVKNICIPEIQFTITRDSMSINGKMCKFVVIQVRGLGEFPIVCTKTKKIDENKALNANNLLLRENAIYIRAKGPIESREISSVQEWRELIGKMLDNQKKELFKKMPCSGLVKDLSISKINKKKMKSSENTKFVHQLKKDKL